MLIEVLKMNENTVAFPEGASPHQKKVDTGECLRQETSGEITFIRRVNNNGIFQSSGCITAMIYQLTQQVTTNKGRRASFVVVDCLLSPHWLAASGVRRPGHQGSPRLVSNLVNVCSLQEYYRPTMRLGELENYMTLLVPGKWYEEIRSSQTQRNAIILHDAFLRHTSNFVVCFEHETVL